MLFSGGWAMSLPAGHQPMIRQLARALLISTLVSPTKTGAPCAMILVLAMHGGRMTRRAIRTSKIYFPCMRSNFKTLMINIMTFFTYSA